MILVSEHNVADNGMQVQSSVELFIERINVVSRPFRVDVSVDHARVFTGHFATEAQAKEERKRMHAAYLEVHSNTPA